METNEKIKLFLGQNNLLPSAFDTPNTIYRIEYNLGSEGVVEVDDIDLEGEYITRLLATNPYTVIFRNNNEKILSINMENPL